MSEGALPSLAIAPVQATDRVGDIFELFDVNTRLKSVPVVDGSGKALGLIERQALLTRLAGPFGRDLYAKKQAIDVCDTSVPRVLDTGDDLSTARLIQRMWLREHQRECFLIVDENDNYVAIGDVYLLVERLLKLQAETLRGLRRKERELSRLNADMENEVRERRAAEARAVELSLVDSLTGLANRRRFQERIATLCESEREFWLVYIDLDRFKPLNDRYTHAAGDKVLATIGKRLLALDRGVRAARLGGDEFAVTIENVTVPGADPVAHIDTVLRRVTAAIVDPIGFEGYELSVGASVGVAAYPADADTSDQLVRAADEAMLRAKKAGGGIEWSGEDPLRDVA